MHLEFTILLLFFFGSPPQNLYLEVQPNNAPRAAQTLTITVSGVPYHQSITLDIARDVDGDLSPDFDRGPTGGLILSRPGKRAQNGRISDLLDLTDERLPEGVELWLRARTDGGESPHTRFSIDMDTCGLWQTLLETFAGGDCKLILGQAFYQHRGLDVWKHHNFHIVLVDIATDKEVTAPDHTAATGLFWVDSDRLLITRDGPGNPGLFLFSLKENREQQLWRGRGGCAPFMLGPNRYGLFRQANAGNELIVLDRKPRPVTLPMDRVLRVKNNQILAVYQAPDSTILNLFLLDAATGYTRNLGSNPRVVNTFDKAPHRPWTPRVFYQEEVARGSWIEVQDDAEETIMTLGRRPSGFAIHPLFSPNGSHLAYLRSMPR